MSKAIERNETTFADRLKMALNQRSARSLALEIGMSPSVLSDYATGKTQPSLKYVVDIADRLGVSLEWMAAGRGPMLRDSRQQDERPALGALDAEVLTLAINHLEELERETGRKLPASVRGETVAALYRALIVDRLSHRPPPDHPTK